MWDKRYSGESYAYGTEPNDFLRAQVGRLPAGKTLCLGEGEGRNGVFLAGLGHEITALDGSAAGLAKAQQLAAQRGVKIKTVHADLVNYELAANGWDVIVSIFCHLPAALRIKVHGQVAQSLRAGGVFILEAFTPRQLEFGTGGPPAAEMMMDLATLRHELAGLEFDVARETVRDIHEGAFHNGPSAVVQLVARKPMARDQ